MFDSEVEIIRERLIHMDFPVLGLAQTNALLVDFIGGDIVRNLPGDMLRKRITMLVK